jgi:SAM-dependent methyltransferase
MLLSNELLIPPKGMAPKPDADDPVDYYYHPVVGWLYRARLSLAIDLLGPRRYDSILEVGYGSGIFLPELARHAERIAGIDIHTESARVKAMLERLGLDADLREGTLFELPWEDSTFDGVVCLSVLEHLVELDAALGEFRRVLRPGGVAVLGFPARNPLTDTFFRLVGYNPRAIHPSSHTDILDAAKRHPGFTVEMRRHFPRLLPTAGSAYVACRCLAR